jgi:hypothetical protein
MDEVGKERERQRWNETGRGRMEISSVESRVHHIVGPTLPDGVWINRVAPVETRMAVCRYRPVLGF